MSSGECCEVSGERGQQQRLVESELIINLCVKIITIFAYPTSWIDKYSHGGGIKKIRYRICMCLTISILTTVRICAWTKKSPQRVWVFLKKDFTSSQVRL